MFGQRNTGQGFVFICSIMYKVYTDKINECSSSTSVTDLLLLSLLRLLLFVLLVRVTYTHVRRTSHTSVSNCSFVRVTPYSLAHSPKLVSSCCHSLTVIIRVAQLNALIPCVTTATTKTLLFVSNQYNVMSLWVSTTVHCTTPSLTRHSRVRSCVHLHHLHTCVRTYVRSHRPYSPPDGALSSPPAVALYWNSYYGPVLGLYL